MAEIDEIKYNEDNTIEEPPKFQSPFETVDAPESYSRNIPLSSEQVEEFFPEGSVLPSNPEKYGEELALRQGWEKGRNALIQAIVNEVGLSSVENTGYLIDLPETLTSVVKGEGDVDNALSRFVRGIKEDVREAYPIYSTGKVGEGYFWENVPSIASSLGFLLPVGIANAPLKAVGKLAKIASRGKTAQNIFKGIGIGTSAIASRGMENNMEGIGVYEKVKNDYLSGKKIKEGISPEEALSKAEKDLMDSGLADEIKAKKEELNSLMKRLDKYNPETDDPNLPNQVEQKQAELEDLMNKSNSLLDSKYNEYVERKYTPEEAEKAAVEAFRTNYIANSAMLMQDVLEWTALAKGGKALMSAIGKRKLAKSLAQEGVETTQVGVGEVAKDLFKPVDLLGMTVGEGFEEYYQSLATDLSIWNTDVNNNVKGEDRTFSQALKESGTSEEAFTSALFGALGGLVMGTGGKAIKDYTDASLDQKIDEIKNWGTEFDVINQSKEQLIKKGLTEQADYLSNLQSNKSALRSAMNDNTENAIKFFENRKNKLSQVPENETEEEKEIREEELKNIDNHIESFKNVKKIYNEEVNKDEELAPSITMYKSTIDGIEKYRKAVQEKINKTKVDFESDDRVSEIGKGLYEIEIANKANKNAIDQLQNAINKKLIPDEKKVKQAEKDIKRFNKYIENNNLLKENILKEDDRESTQKELDSEIIKNALINNDKHEKAKTELEIANHNLDYYKSQLAYLQNPKNTSKVKEDIQKNKISKEQKYKDKKIQKDLDAVNKELLEAAESATSFDELKTKFNELGTKAETIKKNGLDNEVSNRVISKLKELKKEVRESEQKDIEKIKSIEEYKKEFNKKIEGKKPTVGFYKPELKDRYSLEELKALKQRIDNKEETRTPEQVEALNQVIKERESGEKVFNIPERLDNLNLENINPLILKRIKKAAEENDLVKIDKLVQIQEKKQENIPIKEAKEASNEALELADTYSYEELESLMKAKNKAISENNPKILTKAMEVVAKDKKDAFSPEQLDYIGEAMEIVFKDNVKDEIQKAKDELEYFISEELFPEEEIQDKSPTATLSDVGIEEISTGINEKELLEAFETKELEEAQQQRFEEAPKKMSLQERENKLNKIREISEKLNEELPELKESQVFTTSFDGREFDVKGNRFYNDKENPLNAVTTDKKGNLVVELKDRNGKTIKFTGVEAEVLEYEILLQEAYNKALAIEEVKTVKLDRVKDNIKNADSYINNVKKYLDRFNEADKRKRGNNFYSTLKNTLTDINDILSYKRNTQSKKDRKNDKSYKQLNSLRNTINNTLKKLENEKDKSRVKRANTTSRITSKIKEKIPTRKEENIERVPQQEVIEPTIERKKDIENSYIISESQEEITPSNPEDNSSNTKVKDTSKEPVSTDPSLESKIIEKVEEENVKKVKVAKVKGLVPTTEELLGLPKENIPTEEIPREDFNPFEDVPEGGIPTFKGTKKAEVIEPVVSEPEIEESKDITVKTNSGIITIKPDGKMFNKSGNEVTEPTIKNKALVKKELQEGTLRITEYNGTNYAILSDNRIISLSDTNAGKEVFKDGSQREQILNKVNKPKVTTSQESKQETELEKIDREEREKLDKEKIKVIEQVNELKNKLEYDKRILLTDLLDKFNIKNKFLNNLYKILKPFLRLLSIRIIISSKNVTAFNGLAAYNLKEGIIVVNIQRLQETAYKQFGILPSNLAKREHINNVEELFIYSIIHEGFHGLTNHITELHDKFYNTGDLSKVQKEALDKLYSIFKYLNSLNNNELSNEYGLTTIDEFIAELSNETFVTKLSKIQTPDNLKYNNKHQNIFKTLIDYIVSLFTNSKNSNIYEEVSKIISDVLQDKTIINKFIGAKGLEAITNDEIIIEDTIEKIQQKYQQKRDELTKQPKVSTSEQSIEDVSDIIQESLSTEIKLSEVPLNRELMTSRDEYETIEGDILKTNSQGQVIQRQITVPGGFKLDKLDTLDVKVGDEVEFVIIENPEYLKDLEEKSLDKYQGQQLEEWEYIPIFVKHVKSGDIISRLGAHKSGESLNIDRKSIYDNIKSGKRVKASIKTKGNGAIMNYKTQDGSNKDVFYNLNDTYNEETLNGKPPILAVFVGSIHNEESILKWDINQGSLENYGISPKEFDNLLSKINSSQQKDTIPGSIAVVRMSGNGEYRIHKVLTKTLTPKVIDRVIELMKNNDVEKISEIVNPISASELKASGYNQDKFIDYDATFMSYYSPTLGKIVKFNNEQFLKALNGEKPVFTITGFKEDEEAGTLEVNNVPSIKDINTLTEVGLINDLTKFLSSKRFQVSFNKTNKDGKITSPITGKEYNNYWDYLTSEDETGKELSETEKSSSILTTNVARNGQSLYRHIALTFNNSTEFGKEDKTGKEAINTAIETGFNVSAPTIKEASKTPSKPPERGIKSRRNVSDAKQKLLDASKNKAKAKINEMKSVLDEETIRQATEAIDRLTIKDNFQEEMNNILKAVCTPK